MKWFWFLTDKQAKEKKIFSVFLFCCQTFTFLQTEIKKKKDVHSGTLTQADLGLLFSFDSITFSFFLSVQAESHSATLLCFLLLLLPAILLSYSPPPPHPQTLCRVTAVSQISRPPPCQQCWIIYRRAPQNKMWSIDISATASKLTEKIIFKNLKMFPVTLSVWVKNKCDLFFVFFKRTELQ